MAQNIIPGIRLTTSFTVSVKDTAAVYGSGLLDVLSTPAMIALMEQTAMRAVEGYLDEGEGTVGTLVSIRHTRATPVGAEITCTAVLAEAEGRRLLFRVEASDGKGIIGEGSHERYIIDNERFMNKIREEW